MWAVLGFAGLLVVVTGWLPCDEASQIAVHRGAPIMVFLVAVTVLAELADRAGVFDVAAAVCARAGRGSTLRLFLLVAVLGTATTVFAQLTPDEVVARYDEVADSPAVPVPQGRSVDARCQS